MKKIGIALTAATGAALVACTVSETGPVGPGHELGKTAVFLTDAPFPFDFIQRVDVHITEIALSPQADTSDTAPDWLTVATPDRSFNLVELQNGVTEMLGQAEIPPGQYRAVRVIFDPSRSSMTDVDGHVIGTAPAGGGPGIDWQSKRAVPQLFGFVEEPLAVDDNGTDIVIDFDVGRSFLYDGAGGFTFVPFLRAITRTGSGSITGVLRNAAGDPIPSAAVEIHYAFDTSSVVGPLIATSRSGGDGRFTASFLRPETYQVVPVDLSRNLQGPVRRVTVKAGETADAGEFRF